MENQKNRKKVFLIGNGISNSYSVLIHNAAFEQLGINATYELQDLTGRSLASFVASLRGRTDVLGFNVTAPFKEDIIPYLSSSDRRSKFIGAVNTVKISKGVMRGYNTDYDGIVASLVKIGAQRKGRSALILGAGGAARACVSVLLDLGYADITILNRTLRRRKNLEREFSTRRRNKHQKISSATLTGENFKEQIRNGCDLVVNTISRSNSEHFPVKVDFSLAKRGCAVFDLGYKEESLLLSTARQQEGLRAIDGLLMLVVQAAKSFEIWTGRKAPLKTMMQVAKMLGRQQVSEKLPRGPESHGSLTTSRVRKTSSA